MENTIFFSKVEFQEYLGYAHRSSLFLNLVEKELSYQVYAYKRQMPSIRGVKYEKYGEHEYSNDIHQASVVLKNEKTGFKPKIFITESYLQETIFSYAKKLTDEQMKNLLIYCNVLDFEPYRNREMSMHDKGFVGYRDGVQVVFKAITDSYIPKIELPMEYYYDEDHIWPNEKLYRYVLRTFLESNKNAKDWILPYGGHSLFFKL